VAHFVMRKKTLSLTELQV